MRVPECFKITFTGAPAPFILGKDIILKLLADLVRTAPYTDHWSLLTTPAAGYPWTAAFPYQTWWWKVAQRQEFYS